MNLRGINIYAPVRYTHAPDPLAAFIAAAIKITKKHKRQS